VDELVEEYGHPFDLAILNDLGDFVEKHGVRFGWWISYDEAITFRNEQGRLVELKQNALEPARVGAVTRIQYHFERADGVQVSVTGAFKNAFRFGQTALARACRD
jgi:hypothetical protein